MLQLIPSHSVPSTKPSPHPLLHELPHPSGWGNSYIINLNHRPRPIDNKLKPQTLRRRIRRERQLILEKLPHSSLPAITSIIRQPPLGPDPHTHKTRIGRTGIEKQAEHQFIRRAHGQAGHALRQERWIPRTVRARLANLIELVCRVRTCGAGRAEFMGGVDDVAGGPGWEAAFEAAVLDEVVGGYHGGARGGGGFAGAGGAVAGGGGTAASGCAGGEAGGGGVDGGGVGSAEG